MTERLSKLLNRLLWMALFCAGFYIVFSGMRRFWTGNISGLLKESGAKIQRVCDRELTRWLYPGFFSEYENDGDAQSLTEWYLKAVTAMHPLNRLQYGAKSSKGTENAATYEMLITGGAHDENEESEEFDMESLAEAENAEAAKNYKEELEQEAKRMREQAETDAPETIAAGTIYNLEELSDFEYLFSHFYTMEANTTISSDDLNAERLLAKDMTIDLDTDGPQILIYHTHSQEGFVDSVPGDNSTTIVGVGEYLAQLLREKGYNVMHITSVYDLIGGELDRSEAYSRAYDEISAILEENPSIQAVIDLHRDGVEEGTRLVTDVNGKTCARFMFFNGLSRTKKNGSIDYLYNPYIEDNLALTLQLKLKSEQYYPGLARNIYLKSLRYNLHLSDKALLIEAGAQTNTLQEMKNTMEPLADILDKVFDP